MLLVEDKNSQILYTSYCRYLEKDIGHAEVQKFIAIRMVLRKVKVSCVFPIRRISREHWYPVP